MESTTEMESTIVSERAGIKTKKILTLSLYLRTHLFFFFLNHHLTVVYTVCNTET